MLVVLAADDDHTAPPTRVIPVIKPYTGTDAPAEIWRRPDSRGNPPTPAAYRPPGVARAWGGEGCPAPAARRATGYCARQVRGAVVVQGPVFFSLLYLYPFVCLFVCVCVFFKVMMKEIVSWYSLFFTFVTMDVLMG